MAQGREFSADNPADNTSSMIVNEAMLKIVWVEGCSRKKITGKDRTADHWRGKRF
jgi:hypothetical protein